MVEESAEESQQVPALNEIRRQTGKSARYPEDPESKRYIILYPEDYEGHGIDVDGNIALLVDKEQAREVKQLAEMAIQELEDND